MAIKNGTPVPISLESLRFLVAGKMVMAADVQSDSLLMDIPDATNKMFSFTLDPTLYYQCETVVAHENMSVQTLFGVETNVSDKSPNLVRNKFTGQFDAFNVYLVPSPTIAPTPTPTPSTP